MKYICDVCGYEYVFIFKLKYDESGYELDRVGPATRVATLLSLPSTKDFL